jgi:quercetin dioxygenase-like cupin family protein
VAGLETKNVGEPDETRPFAGKGQAAVVNIAGRPVLYVTYEPGWRWPEHLKPILGTESCEATHLLYCLSGRSRVETNRGEQGEIGPGDVAAIEPGHDAWTVAMSPAWPLISAAMFNTRRAKPQRRSHARNSGRTRQITRKSSGRPLSADSTPSNSPVDAVTSN